MPDISNKGAHQYWFEYKDSAVYRVVSFMESVEDWTLDGDPNLEESIQKLGIVLDDVGNVDLQCEEDFVKILAYVKAARMLRIMQCLDVAHPGAASKLLMHAEKNNTNSDDPVSLFLRRNVVFERLRLLGRVFSPERFALIQKALEEAEHV
ncbi:MAG: type IVB secretion system protein IcmW [Gammaproteobacteria bacterium]